MPFAPARCPVFYGWVIVFVGTVGVICSIPAQTMGIGVFTEILIESLGLSRLELSLAYLVGTLASGLTLPFGGRWIDRVGMRKALVYASAFLGGSLLLLSGADLLSNSLQRALPQLPPLVATFPVVGIAFFLTRFWGQGILTLASRNLIGKWFDQNRGIAVGVSSVAVSLTFSLSPTILNALVQAIGWRFALLSMGLGLIFVFCLFAWCFARDNPEECGLEMDGGIDQSKPPNQNPDLLIDHDYERSEALRCIAFWGFSLSFAWHALFFTAYTFHVVDIGRSLQMARDEIFILFFYAAFLSVAANFGAGWLGKRTRLKYLLAAQNGALALMAFALLACDGMVAKALIVVSMGLGGGLWSNLFGTVFPRFFGRSHVGAISGVAMSLTVISSAVGPYFFSVVKGLFDSYAQTYFIGILVSLAFIALAFASDNPQRHFPKAKAQRIRKR